LKIFLSTSDSSLLLTNKKITLLSQYQCKDEMFRGFLACFASSKAPEEKKGSQSPRLEGFSYHFTDTQAL